MEWQWVEVAVVWVPLQTAVSLCVDLPVLDRLDDDATLVVELLGLVDDTSTILHRRNHGILMVFTALGVDDRNHRCTATQVVIEQTVEG